MSDNGKKKFFWRAEDSLDKLLGFCHAKEYTWKGDGDKDYLEHLAAIHVALGNKTEAIKAYRKLLKVRPGDPEALRYLKGKK